MSQLHEYILGINDSRRQRGRDQLICTCDGGSCRNAITRYLGSLRADEAPYKSLDDVFADTDAKWRATTVKPESEYVWDAMKELDAAFPADHEDA